MAFLLPAPLIAIAHMGEAAFGRPIEGSMWMNRKLVVGMRRFIRFLDLAWIWLDYACMFQAIDQYTWAFIMELFGTVLYLDLSYIGASVCHVSAVFSRLGASTDIQLRRCTGIDIFISFHIHRCTSWLEIPIPSESLHTLTYVSHYDIPNRHVSIFFFLCCTILFFKILWKLNMANLLIFVGF
jgi:hypothetical protein